ncbi:hypothetical protein [Paraburkholderia sp. LEh10]|uniref:hypothetical protein n=1 Tax=Paraburkholderia sp. LEh10 TaxID=2821353 RepID=UPI001FD72AB2|nr:hypothetical protein [Paraburkholderia sp. LEh10]
MKKLLIASIAFVLVGYLSISGIAYVHDKDYAERAVARPAVCPQAFGVRDVLDLTHAITAIRGKLSYLTMLRY